MTSTRLPGKVMKPILGLPMIFREIERIRRARTLSHLVVATSDSPTDDPLVDVCRNANLVVYRGALDDVLSRYAGAANEYKPVDVVRLTGDCPLIDPSVIDRVVMQHQSRGADYTSNVSPPTYPDGLDVEVMKMSALVTANKKATSPAEREHVTLYIARRPDQFRIENVPNPDGDHSRLRWTVDEPADFELVETIYRALYPSKPSFTIQDIFLWLNENPQWCSHNLHHRRNEELSKTLANETGST